MRIGIDSRWMAGNYRGMGKFAHFLISGVRDNVTLLGQPGVGRSLEFGLRFYPAWEQISLPRYVERNGYTHLICPYNTAPIKLEPKVKLILVVHDLIFMEPLSRLPASSSAYQNLGRFYRRTVVPAACRRADYIITVSEHSRNNIMKSFNVDGDRITVIPNSIPDTWLTSEDSRSRSPFLLTVAGHAPSKNLRGLLRAFQILIHEFDIPTDLMLDIAGVPSAGQEAFRSLASRLGIARRLRWHDFLPEAKLMQLYDECTGFVFPSFIEGFGIPLIEAMARGAPIAASQTSVMPSICGEAAIYFDPYDINSMARQLMTLVTNAKLRHSLSQIGRTHVAQFTERTVQTRVRDFWSQVR